MLLKRRVNKELPRSLGTPEWRHCKGEAVGVLLTGMGRGGASSEHGQAVRASLKDSGVGALAPT